MPWKNESTQGVAPSALELGMDDDAQSERREPEPRDQSEQHAEQRTHALSP